MLAILAIQSLVLTAPACKCDGDDVATSAGKQEDRNAIRVSCRMMDGAELGEKLFPGEENFPRQSTYFVVYAENTSSAMLNVTP